MEKEDHMVQEYVHSRLSMINYKMAVHEGDANRRLACYSDLLLVIPIEAIPAKYRNQFRKLRELIDVTLDSIKSKGAKPIRLNGIYNPTATKYIKLLWSIECDLELKK